MKRKISVIFTGALFFLMGCGSDKYHAEIEQTVETQSMINCIFAVNTYVWIKKWGGGPVCIESSRHRYDVPEKEVPAEKARQYAEVYPVFLKTKELLEKNPEGCCAEFK